MIEVELGAPLAGWVIPLEKIPDPVFAQGMVGDGLAIEPIGDTLHAPCAGTISSIHAARHAVTLTLAEGVELLMHIGIDSVGMAGQGFEVLVSPGARVAAGDPLVRFDLDQLALRASAAATPVIVTGPGVDVLARHTGGMVAVGETVLRIGARAAANGVARPQATAGEARRHEAVVALAHGLHARPAARIATALRELRAEVFLESGERRASAASSIAMLGLGLRHGAPVAIVARGADADEAIARVLAVLQHDTDVPTAIVARSQGVVPEGAIGGVSAAPGLAMGPAAWLRTNRPAPTRLGAGVMIERSNLVQGIGTVWAELEAESQGEGQAADVFTAHRAILEDPSLIDAALARIDSGESAAFAILSAAETQAGILRASSDARIAERSADLVDVGERIAHAVLGTRANMAKPPEGAILLADDLLPSQFAALDTDRIAGIALTRGGPTAHVAILAAGIGLPMIVALGAPLEAVAEGTSLLIDCDSGFVRIDPDAQAREGLATARARRAAVEARARTIGAAMVHTADGITVSVQANCGSVADAQAAMAAGADGCGLLRTEFLFLERAAAPDIGEQSAAYRAIFEALPERPITVRLLDVGGDKPAPYLSLPAEENPALGLRGIRVALFRPEILEAQLSAILGLPVQGPLRIMVPMIASAHEMAAVRAVLDRLRGDTAVALGAMVETPAAAIGADLIAAEADFLSIGSNDLTQYALAADRGNAAVAAMLDGLHPGVLRLIAETCTRAGSTPVSVCGGLAADPMAAPILIGLGVRTLSVPPAQVALTKALVTTLTVNAASDHARQALACASAAEVRALARRFAEELSA